MIHRNVTTVAVVLFAFGLAIADERVINERGWLIEFVNPNANNGSIAIKRMVNPQGDVLYSESHLGGLFQLNAGGDYSTNVTLERLGEGQFTLFADEIKDRNGNSVPYELHLNITLKPTRVDFELEISAHGQVRFDSGLSLFTPMNRRAGISFYNTTAGTTGYSWYTDMGPNKRKPFQASARIESPYCNLNLIFPNPLHPVCLLSNDGLNIEILTVAMTNSTVSQGEQRISSILEDGDTITASWVVAASADDRKENLLSTNIVTFSAHPKGAEQSTLLAFDDIPSLEPFWAVATDSKNTHTPITSNLLRLLDLFPDIKFTWLILTDNIQRTGSWYFKEWWPPYESTMPDSEYVFDGDYSCRLSLTEYPGTNSAVLVNIIPVEPYSSYSLGGKMLSTGTGLANSHFTVTARSWPYNTVLGDQTFDHSIGDWESFDLSFDTDSVGTISINFRLAGADADVYIDDTFCKKDGDENNIFHNASFEEFQSFVYYDPPDDPIWANARGCFRIAIEAPDYYHKFLRDIQNEVPFWDYTDQVGLGLHGMHHTPDLEYLEEPTRSVHEFNYYDVRSDSLTILHIVEDLETIGLDVDKIFSIFRFPGHRHTESILKPLFDNNCRIIDQGNFAGNITHFGRLYRQHKMMWMTFSAAWFDNPQFYMNEYLENDLNMGQFCLTGVHYHILASLNTPGKFEETVRMFAWLESQFPKLHWFKGEELAEFWDELGAVTDIKQESFRQGEKFSWSGSTTHEQTILIWLKSEELRVKECLLDGNSAVFEQRGQRVFIVLPRLENGTHSLMAIIDSDQDVQFENRDYQIKVDPGNILTIQNIPLTSIPMEVDIYDISGRRLRRWSNKDVLPPNETLHLTLPEMPAGVYFVKIKRENTIVNRRFTMIR